jgi:hypothetical protein
MRQKVINPFEAISIWYKEKQHGPAYSSVPGTGRLFSVTRGEQSGNVK